MDEPPSGRSHRSLCRACNPITPTKHHRNPKCDTSATAAPRFGPPRRPPRRQHARNPSFRVTPRIPPLSTSAFARTARFGGGRERRRHDRRWNNLRGHLRSCGARRPAGSRHERPFEQRRDVAVSSILCGLPFGAAQARLWGAAREGVRTITRGPRGHWRTDHRTSRRGANGVSLPIENRTPSCVRECSGVPAPDRLTNERQPNRQPNVLDALGPSSSRPGPASHKPKDQHSRRARAGCCFSINPEADQRDSRRSRAVVLGLAPSRRWKTRTVRGGLHRARQSRCGLRP